MQTPPTVAAAARRAPALPPVFVAVTVVTCAAWTAHALGVAADPRRTLSTLLSGIAVFAFLPAIMALAITGVGAVACLALGPIALLASLATGRPSGFGSVAAGLFAPGLALVPGYLRALERCRSPAVWGFVAGSGLAAAALAVWLATRSA